ncbi:MAG: cell wall metabolism sensor histidine kinase WalK [Vicinamibacterales bacterium]|nr:cell wall metabolism sensor histidine kinase WalK [Vicinamibacterales bacterium]
MTIRNRIFAVVGVVIAAAFLQTLIVLQVEGRRAATAASLDRSIWRLENQADLGRLIVELDAAERAVDPGGPPAAAAERDRLWGMYERGAALLPGYLDSPESTRELAAIDALMRDWRRTPPGADRAALMGRIRAGFDRFDTRERSRLADERVKANSQSLQATILTLGIPAVAIVMLLLLVAFVARILLDPLKAIATSAQTISGGNFDVSLPRESRDEIGDLVRAFREMITAVQRREREVTEARIKAEREHQRLQATIETVPVALVIVDAETGRIVLQNRTAGALIGEEPGGAAREAYWRAFGVTTRDGTPVDVRVWGAERVLQGQTIVGEELVVQHPDGREIPILVSAAPLREDNGRISGAVAAFQDITSLYEVDRLKSEFVSIVSHELRTPLTSIKGALQLLIDERRASDPDHAMLLNVALSNTERLVRIINDILDISKIEAGKLELNARPNAVDEVVRQSLQNVEPIARGALVALRADVEPGVPAVHVDLDRVIQVVVNLLSNALKAAPPRSEVTLSARRADDGFVAFSVTDRGRGIAPDKIGLLFQKFQQLDGANTRKAHGTGLGLAIVKALVEMQGGRVSVESTVGHGSTFTVTVPGARG